jgi:hypothetical protein
MFVVLGRRAPTLAPGIPRGRSCLPKSPGSDKPLFVCASEFSPSRLRAFVVKTRGLFHHEGAKTRNGHCFGKGSIGKLPSSQAECRPIVANAAPAAR